MVSLITRYMHILSHPLASIVLGHTDQVEGRSRQRENPADLLDRLTGPIGYCRTGDDSGSICLNKVNLHSTGNRYR